MLHSGIWANMNLYKHMIIYCGIKRLLKVFSKTAIKVAPLQPFKARINTFTAHVQLDTRHKGPSLACEHRFPYGLYVLSHS